MEIGDYLARVCATVDIIVKNNKNKNVKIIDGIGEVEINNIKYQAQMILEPNKKNWVSESGLTVRIIVD